MRALGGEGIFTLSVSFADSSPRVGAKGRPELGQAFGHHDRPPSCGSPLASPFGRGAQCAHWAERAFLPSQSLRDSSPRVGAKGRPELGQAFGHHNRPPSCGSPLASPFGRGAQCAHWAERAICRIRSAETAMEAKDSNCGVERSVSKLVIVRHLFSCERSHGEYVTFHMPSFKSA